MTRPTAPAPGEDALLRALQAAPRRYRLPPLPGDADEARAAGTEAALAYAIEARRAAGEGGRMQEGLRALFTEALADLIRAALVPGSGDAPFQALLLRAQSAAVREHLKLAAQQAADRRRVRSAVDAVAHPGKLRRQPAPPGHASLEALHGLAKEGAWRELRGSIDALLAAAGAHSAPWRDAVQAVVDGPALQRLERGAALLEDPAVQRYRVLCEQQGPRAGTAAAAERGRVSARAGDAAEEATVHAFREIAARLDGYEHTGRYQVVRSLRTPRGFPGAAGKTKDEWDVAIVCGRDEPGGARIVLLAEVKAAPAAVTNDFARLLRGLQRLALAEGAAHGFPSADGVVHVASASLRGLAPRGDALPPHVIYCCWAPPEARPPLLGAAGKAVLLAEPASLAFAQRIAHGEAPDPADLDPVWQALPTAPRLRATLHQDRTARAGREAMLHPQDLLRQLNA